MYYFYIFGGFVIPFLTLYLTTHREIPVSRAALMVSLFGAGSFLAQLIGGELSSSLVTLAAIVILGLSQAIPLIAVSAFAIGDAIADLVSPRIAHGRLRSGYRRK